MDKTEKAIGKDEQVCLGAKVILGYVDVWVGGRKLSGRGRGIPPVFYITSSLGGHVCSYAGASRLETGLPSIVASDLRGHWILFTGHLEVVRPLSRGGTYRCLGLKQTPVMARGIQNNTSVPEVSIRGHCCVGLAQGPGAESQAVLRRTKERREICTKNRQTPENGHRS